MNPVTLNHRDVDFLLYEFLDTSSLLKRERYSEHSKETFDATISGAKNIAEKYYSNHYQEKAREERHAAQHLVRLSLPYRTEVSFAATLHAAFGLQGTPGLAPRVKNRGIFEEPARSQTPKTCKSH